MKRAPIDHASPESVIALPIYHPTRHGAVLLRPGVAVDTDTISKVRQLGVREIWVEAEDLDDVGRHVSVSGVETRAALIEAVHTEFERLGRDERATPRLDPLKEILERLLELATSAPDTARWIHEPDLPDQPILRNAVFSAVVCMLVGKSLESYLVRERPKLAPMHAADVRGLAVAGLMHDVGLLRVDPHVIQYWEETGDETDTRWRQHVRLGYEMIRDRVDPATAAAVLNHHQRFDGNGFPARVGKRADDIGVGGRAVHIFSRIIAAVDAFDRLRVGTADDRPLPRVRVLREMIQGESACKFDPTVVAALARVVPPFPPGARVTLSNGRAATVIGLNDADPCRPPVLVDAAAPTDAATDSTAGETAAASDGGVSTLVELDEQCPLSITHIDGLDVTADIFRLGGAASAETESVSIAA